MTDQATGSSGERDFESVRAQLLEIDLDTTSTATYRSLERLLRTVQDQTIKIAYAGNFTLDLLPSFVNVRAARERMLTSGYVAGIGQHMQELFDDASGLRRHDPDVVLLALSPRLLRPAAIEGFTSLTPEDRAALRDDILAHVEDWIALALERTRATLVVGNFVSPPQPALGVADLAADLGETEFYLELNLMLLRRWRDEPRVQILDVDRVAARVGKDRAADARMQHLAKMEWSETLLRALATEIVRHVKAARGLARKCLVLDLDNTLWGGVLGEEGPLGVKVGTGDPQGEAYAAFQSRIRALRDRGVLLALCSKNNPADVEELFELRPDMPLKRSDFAAVSIGWEAKHLGLQAIARELSIGIDSLVFVDDNPAEIALVREMLPEVETVLLPPDPARFVAVLDALTSFEKPVVLRDDAAKSDQYRHQQERQAFARGAGDLSAYLAGLETRLAIRSAGASDIARVQQLFAKTNQFNLTTRRYGAGDVERFIGSPDHELIVATAADRFGDLGLIAVCLVERAGREWAIDSFLMSCRAMGRGIETALMNHVKTLFAADRQAERLVGSFVATAKNAPAADFLESEGFEPVAEAEGGTRRFVLDRSEVRLKDCAWIKVDS